MHFAQRLAANQYPASYGHHVALDGIPAAGRQPREGEGSHGTHEVALC
jgi:hypothetical protein